MSTPYKYTALLTIAGSDSGGGAGIQADLKTFSALGCYGTSAITAITVQNTLGVTGIHSIPATIVQQQIKVVMDDIKPMAIKIGMVHSAELALAIATVVKDYPQVPVIFDPVMVSTSGHRLIEKDTIVTLQKELFPISRLITPNLNEAEILAAMKIDTLADMQEAARHMIKAGCNAVLVKGGHLQGPDLFDLYLDKNGAKKIFQSAAVSTQNTHGTGCTLSSAIAAFVGLNHDICTAIEKAKAYVHQAIVAGHDVKTGEGEGPLNHFFDPQKLIKHKVA
ncbi:bifunctional hydroxymethylpyrimidine kinase/phosphomethylpyrimidine kinase [Mucilaginibacter flavus]|uniref:bifunctional hydroxymethylpyrimidine kinase/phosphomethylpyrimidine kinase n=1 Tax=Mucilaginibacter flavus TaxID=931504 RepID=UPI0025B4DF9B|nr:bifunctional hydroxymethylpyrimidine kinase/phosphomethylpyrimidine kinase [Mucilaginibacter flavus]MDN3580890.1 bifunctional hydroxymethylpyrimidine kinase/phosphomethylpyrimidine kinase [Mucilaginibacter flavus]